MEKGEKKNRPRKGSQIKVEPIKEIKQIHTTARNAFLARRVNSLHALVDGY